MSRLGVLLIGLLIVSGVYAGFQVFPFYYDFYELQGMMEAQAAKADVFSDAEIRTTLMQHIKKLDIPIRDERDLRINRVGRGIIIEANYEEVLYLDLGGDRVYDLHTFKFNPRAESRL